MHSKAMKGRLDGYGEENCNDYLWSVNMGNHGDEWADIRDNSVPTEVRWRRLLQAVVNKDERVKSYILQTLSSPPGPWTPYILFAAEQALSLFQTEQDRDALARSILRTVDNLGRDDLGEDQDLDLLLQAQAAAFRLFGLTAPLKCADMLTKYINDDLDSCHLAYTAILGLFSVEPPRPGDAIALRNAVAHSTIQMLQRANRSDEEVAVLTSAIESLVSLAVEDTPEILKSRRGQLHSDEAAFVADHLRDLSSRWPEKGKVAGGLSWSEGLQDKRANLVAECLATLQNRDTVAS